MFIALQSEHGGCWNVMHFADAEPAVFSRREPGTWTEVRVVASERAHFFAQPRDSSVERAYAVRGDAVVVLSAAPGWMRARIRETEGWLRDTDLYSDAVPANSKQPCERPDGSGTANAGKCDIDAVWDTKARACRMYPGGSYGWAGCSMAHSPPGGFKCVTGAHWVPSLCRHLRVRWHSSLRHGTEHLPVMRRKKGPFCYLRQDRKSFTTSGQDAGFVAIAASRVVTRHHAISHRHGNVRSTGKSRAKIPKVLPEGWRVALDRSRPPSR